MNDPRILSAHLIPASAAVRFLSRLYVFLPLCMPANLAMASSLSEDAASRAQHLAELTPWSQQRSQQSSPHPLGVQTLSIEKQESKHTPDTTLLSVYQFNYVLQQARRLTIDANNSQVLKIRRINSVHLPLSAAEIAHAAQLLSARESIMDQLRDEQINRGLVAFETLSDLDVKASIYEPLDTFHPCRAQRCALMSLFDDTHTVFSTEPVINLQSLTVNVLEF